MTQIRQPESAPTGGPRGFKNQALEAAATTREAFGHGTKSISEYISKQPARALGLALGLGVLLGWLIKRR